EFPGESDHLHGAARWKPARTQPEPHRRAAPEDVPARRAGTQPGSVRRCIEPDEYRHNRERPEPSWRCDFIRCSGEVHLSKTAATRSKNQVLTEERLKLSTSDVRAFPSPLQTADSARESSERTLRLRRSDVRARASAPDCRCSEARADRVPLPRGTRA